jgi:ribonuclease E
LRVAVICILLGTVIGASIVTLKSSRDHNTDVTYAMTHLGTSGVEATSAPSADVMAVGAESGTIKTDGTAVDADKTDGKRTDPRKSDATSKSDVSKTNASKADASKADASKAACEDSTWTYLDGSCIPGKPRRVKVRAATDRPAIAAAPLGRTAAAPLDVVAPSPAAATAPEGAPLQGSAESPAAASSATPPAATPPPAAAAPRKPQRTARSHRRNDGEGPARDDVRSRGYVVYEYGRGGYGEPVRSGPFGWIW